VVARDEQTASFAHSAAVFSRQSPEREREHFPPAPFIEAFDLADGLVSKDLRFGVCLLDGFGIVRPPRRQRRVARLLKTSAQRSQLLGSSHNPWMNTTGGNPVALASSICFCSYLEMVTV
jgi:hypothetical protein